MSEQVGLPYWPHSKTSKQAAKSMVKKAPNMRQRVWEYIHSRGGEGATIDEVNMHLDILNSCATRVTELRRLGRVEQAGVTRPTRSGRQAEVYVAVEELFWTDQRPGWPTPPHIRNRRVKELQEHRDRYPPDFIEKLQQEIDELRVLLMKAATCISTHSYQPELLREIMKAVRHE